MLGTGQRHQNKRVRCIPGTPEGCAWLLELLVCTQEKTYFIWFPTSWLFPFLCPGTLFGFPTISAALIYRGILGAPVGNTVFYGFLIGGSMHKPKPLKLIAAWHSSFSNVFQPRLCLFRPGNTIFQRFPTYPLCCSIRANVLEINVCLARCTCATIKSSCGSSSTIATCSKVCLHSRQQLQQFMLVLHELMQCRPNELLRKCCL